MYTNGANNTTKENTKTKQNMIEHIRTCNIKEMTQNYRTQKGENKTTESHRNIEVIVEDTNIRTKERIVKCEKITQSRIRDGNRKRRSIICRQDVNKDSEERQSLESSYQVGGVIT